jgi:hypothetical protein
MGGKTLGMRERVSVVIPKVNVYDSREQWEREDERNMFIAMAARMMGEVEEAEKPQTYHMWTQTQNKTTSTTTQVDSDDYNSDSDVEYITTRQPTKDFQSQVDAVDILTATYEPEVDYSTVSDTTSLSESLPLYYAGPSTIPFHGSSPEYL